MLPDVTGYENAQDSLIDKMGQDVIFSIPGVVVWPDGTVLDPERNEPMDPRVEPESDGRSEVTIKGRVFTPALMRRDRTSETPIGFMRENQIAIRIKVSDYEAIKEADSVTVLARVYQVKDIIEDGITDLARYYVLADPR